jgi:hypothetical protein
VSYNDNQTTADWHCGFGYRANTHGASFVVYIAPLVIWPRMQRQDIFTELMEGLRRLTLHARFYSVVVVSRVTSIPPGIFAGSCVEALRKMASNYCMQSAPLLFSCEHVETRTRARSNRRRSLSPHLSVISFHRQPSADTQGKDNSDSAGVTNSDSGSDLP